MAGRDEELRDLERRVAAGGASLDELDRARVDAGLRIEALDVASFDSALRRLLVRQGARDVRRYARVEWDPDFRGGDYDKVGRFADIVMPPDLGTVLSVAALRRAFEAQTGAKWRNVIHYDTEELYDAEGRHLPGGEIPDDVNSIFHASKLVLRISANQSKRGDVVEGFTACENWAVQFAHLSGRGAGSIVLGARRTGDLDDLVHEDVRSLAWPELEGESKTSAAVERWAREPALDRMVAPAAVAWRWAGYYKRQRPAPE